MRKEATATERVEPREGGSAWAARAPCRSLRGGAPARTGGGCQREEQPDVAQAGVEVRERDPPIEEKVALLGEGYHGAAVPALPHLGGEDLGLPYRHHVVAGAVQDHRRIGQPPDAPQRGESVQITGAMPQPQHPVAQPHHRRPLPPRLREAHVQHGVEQHQARELQPRAGQCRHRGHLAPAAGPSEDDLGRVDLELIGLVLDIAHAAPRVGH
mmetsp:Transcript_67917/g.180574  ORF Transcript_67917/g.180574 Transcript_67917/m.180574 type:complete len:213 (-) Transcript_67917:125-763(-)